MEDSDDTSRNRDIIDRENVAETARLLEQDQALTRQMGLLPAPIEAFFPLWAEQSYQVLDLACGPGGWAVELAMRFPELTVVGVDRSEAMVQYAAALAQVKQVRNAQFQVMDVTQPLAFPDASFHFVHARFLAGFMRPQDWPILVQACRRVLKPGGTLCLSESEWALTTSRAFETLKRRVSMALWLAKQSLSVDGQDLGITARLASFLREAGYQQIQRQSCAFEWSTGTPPHAASYFQCQALFELLRPFVLKRGVISEETYHALYEQLLQEISAPDFCAITMPLSVWGQTPGTDTPA